ARFDPAQQSRGGVGMRRADHGVSLDARSIGERDAPRIALALDRGYIGATANRTFEARDKRVGQRAHAAAQRQKQAPSRAASSMLLRPSSLRSARSTHEASVATFHLDKARHRRAHAEFFGVGCIDAACERLRDAIEDLAAEPARDKRCETFVARVVAL